MAEPKATKKLEGAAAPRKAKKAKPKKAKPKQAKPRTKEPKQTKPQTEEPETEKAKTEEVPEREEPKTEDGAETKAPELPSIEEAVSWIDAPVDDSSGQRIGRVVGIQADATSKEPKWLIVRLGRFAGDAAIPFEHTVEGGGRVWVAYNRDEVRNSPKLTAGQPLNAGQELQLCEHYGIRIGVGRAAEVAERKGDETSAVPAQ